MASAIPAGGVMLNHRLVRPAESRALTTLILAILVGLPSNLPALAATHAPGNLAVGGVSLSPDVARPGSTATETIHGANGSWAASAASSPPPHAGTSNPFLDPAIASPSPPAPWNLVAQAAAASMPKPGAKPRKTKKSAPDLTVSALSLPAGSGKPAQVDPGQKLHVSVTVKNAGTETAAASTARLSIAPAGSASKTSGLLLATAGVPSLAPGASVTLPVTLTIPAVEPQTYDLIAMADPSLAVPEASESNNTKTVPVEVVEKPSSPPEDEEEVYPPPGGPNGPQFYVAMNGNDASDGSLAHPWRTIQHAAALAGPGSTVNVAPGTYAGPVITERDGTAASRIRFLSSARWGARIYYAGVDYWQVWMNTGDYVDIVGFDVSGGGDVRNGIQNNASFVRIMHNYVHDIPNKGCADSNGGAGIVNGNESASDSEIVANVVHDIGHVNKPCNIIHGIYHSHLRGRIANNVTFRNQGSGIHTWHSANKVIIVNNLTFANGIAGVIVGAASDSGVVADHFDVRNNIIVYNQYGMYESGATGQSNRYYNNLLYGNTVWDLALDNPDYDTITKDPAFVDYKSNGKGDYRLSPWSPAIDAGSSVNAPATDIMGLPRPNGKAFDIGPYEWRP
jgi:hypothetical protein